MHHIRYCQLFLTLCLGAIVLAQSQNEAPTQELMTSQFVHDQISKMGDWEMFKSWLEEECHVCDAYSPSTKYASGMSMHEYNH